MTEIWHWKGERQKEKRRRDSDEESFGSAYMASQLAYSFCSPTTHFVSKYMGHKNTFQPVKKKVKADEREEMRGGRADGFL